MGNREKKNDSNVEFIAPEIPKKEYIKEYNLSYWEYLYFKGQQKIFDHVFYTTGTSYTLYTVPKDYIFFITNSMIYMAAALNYTNPKSKIIVNNNNIMQCQVYIRATTSGTTSISNNYSIPIKVNENESITFERITNIGNNTGCVVIGFLVHKSFIEI